MKYVVDKFKQLTWSIISTNNGSRRASGNDGLNISTISDLDFHTLDHFLTCRQNNRVQKLSH